MTLRVVLVSRRFWPLLGDAESAITDLALGLLQHDVEATILTARWDARWSERMIYHGIPVIRLPHPSTREWGQPRYETALSRWLKAQRAHYDLVCVSRLRQSAATVLEVARRTGKGVAIRVVDAGPEGDCAWAAERARGEDGPFRSPPANYIATDAVVQRELLEAGYPRERIHVIADGIASGPPADLPTRREARAALAEINRDLAARDETPVAVYAGPLLESRGLRTLVAAWARVLICQPAARLWLIGEGPLREELHQLKNDLGLGESVRMPGTFDDLSDVLRAADVFVHPAPAASVPRPILEAIAAQLPLVLAGPCGGNPASPLIGSDHARIVAAGQATALASAIQDWLDRPRPTTALSAARRRVLERQCLERMLLEHARLFTALAAAGG